MVAHWAQCLPHELVASVEERVASSAEIQVHGPAGGLGVCWRKAGSGDCTPLTA